MVPAICDIYEHLLSPTEAQIQNQDLQAHQDSKQRRKRDTLVHACKQLGMPCWYAIKIKQERQNWSKPQLLKLLYSIWNRVFILHSVQSILAKLPNQVHPKVTPNSSV